MAYKVEAPESGSLLDASLSWLQTRVPMQAPRYLLLYRQYLLPLLSLYLSFLLSHAGGAPKACLPNSLLLRRSVFFTDTGTTKGRARWRGVRPAPRPASRSGRAAPWDPAPRIVSAPGIFARDFACLPGGSVSLVSGGHMFFAATSRSHRFGPRHLENEVVDLGYMR